MRGLARCDPRIKDTIRGHFSAGKTRKGQEQKYGIIYEGYFSGDHWHGSGQLTLRGGHTIKAASKEQATFTQAQELVPPKSHFSPETAIWIDLEETRLWIGNFLDGKPHGKGSMHYWNGASPFRCANGIFDHGILEKVAVLKKKKIEKKKKLKQKK